MVGSTKACLDVWRAKYQPGKCLYGWQHTTQQGISGPQPHMQLPAHAHKNLDQLTLGAFWMTLANSDAFI